MYLSRRETFFEGSGVEKGIKVEKLRCFLNR